MEESQSEASRLRQRVEELVRDNEALKSSSIAASLCMGGHIPTETQSRSQHLDGNDGFHPCYDLHLCNFTLHIITTKYSSVETWINLGINCNMFQVKANPVCILLQSRRMSKQSV